MSKRIDHAATSDGSVPWWRDAVIYQIYPRSFADSNGDGVGDLAGIRAHIDAIVALGVDAVWLSPFYPSPQADAGYDVADYREVDPLFGSLEEFDALVTDLHDAGIRIIVDIVPNHTSSEHRWFREAVAADPGSAERGRYIFRSGRGADGSIPPNDWQSMFGGDAWTRVADGEWYLHLFAPEQPDLDWMNPEVRAEFESIIRFWLDRGVDGFRIDVAHGLVKDPDLVDLDGRYDSGGLAEPGHPHWDQDEVHDVYRSWRRVADEYDGERVFVAEAYLTSPERLAMYVRPDELHTAFNFRFLMSPWDPAALRDAISGSLAQHRSVGAPTTWVLENHDVVRCVTRYGGGTVGVRRARAAALLMLGLPGSAYVYQGEELGLPEVEDLPGDVRQDPTFYRTGGAEPGRDGCRVPLPWSSSRPSYGFSDSDAAWLPQPHDWGELARAEQDGDPTSMLSLFRDAMERRTHVAAADPDHELDWLVADPAVLAFARPGGFISVTNLGRTDHAAPAETAGATILLTSAPLDDPKVVPSDTTVWFRLPD